MLSNQLRLEIKQTTKHINPHFSPAWPTAADPWRRRFSFPFSFHLGKAILQRSCQNTGGWDAGWRGLPRRKWLPSPASHSEDTGLQLLTHEAHLEKKWRLSLLQTARLNGSEDHPEVSYPEERRKALSVVSDSKVFRLRPHCFNDVLIKRGSFFLENKTRHSTGKLQGHHWRVGKIRLFICFVVSHEPTGKWIVFGKYPVGQEAIPFLDGRVWTWVCEWALDGLAISGIACGKTHAVCVPLQREAVFSSHQFSEEGSGPLKG